MRLAGRRTAAVALTLVVLVAAAARLVGLDWDDGSQAHPDERFITMVTTSLGRGALAPSGPRAASLAAECRARHAATNGVGPWLDTACSDYVPANTGHGFFPYGLWPIAAVRFAAGAFAAAHDRLPRYAEIVTAGRIGSTLADLVALACAYLLGRALGGRRAGLAAALLYALAWLPLQLARFYTVDAFATALASLALVFAVRLASRGERADALAFGVAIGFAAAAKLSLAPMAALVAVAALLAPRRSWKSVLASCSIAAAAVVVTFRIAQPHWFAGPGLLDVAPAPGVLEGLRAIASQQAGHADAPPAWQWIARTPYVDPLRNLMLYGLGPALALAAVAGLALAVPRACRGPALRRRRTIVVLAFVLGYGAFVGAGFVSSMRYWLPLYPALAALGGWALAVGTARLRRRVRSARALPAVAFGVAALAAAAWLAIPLSAPTRLWASHWILERVPAGASAPLTGEAGAMPRRVNWPIDGPVSARGTSARTTVTTGGRIERLALALDMRDGTEVADRVMASLTRDDGKVLLAPTSIALTEPAQPPPGFLRGQAVRLATLPAPIDLAAGARVDLRLSADGPLALGGTTIAHEGPWDDPVPIRMRRLPPDTVVTPGVPGFVRAGSRAEGVDPFGQRYFRGAGLNLAHADDERKRAGIAEALDRATLLTISSQRFVDAVARDPYRFPLTVGYYEALFDGRLGFDVVATFVSPASLGPLAFDADVHPWEGGYLATRARAERNPEEALSVYDHPPVVLLRKRDDYDGARVREILAGPLVRTLDEARRAEPPAAVGRVQRTPAQASAQPGLLMLPPARIASLEAEAPPSATLGSLGAAAAWYVVVALLGASALPWLVAAMPRAPALAFALARPLALFGVGAIAWWGTWAGAPLWRPLPLALIAAAFVAAGAIAARRRRAAIADAWRREGLRVEIAFAALFALAIALRLLDPDLWTVGYGGEKPMDLAILNAVMRTDTFPPPDAWFAGGVLNYYYGGFVPVAALAVASGTPAAIASNLGVALWMALTGAALFGVARTIALALVPARAMLAAVVSTVLGVAAGTLGIGVALADAPPRGEGWIARALAAVASPDPRWYWSPTRFIAERTRSGHEIQEFPFFSFLHADLHAHLLALPLMLAVWGVATWVVLDRGDGARRPMIAALLLGALAALARTANTWDWPVATAIGAGALVVAGLAGGRPGAPRRIAAALLAFALAQAVVAWPFTASFTTGGIALSSYAGPPTPLLGWLIHAGLFAWLLVPWLLATPRPAAPTTRANDAMRAALGAAASVCFAAAVAGAAIAAWRGTTAPALGAMLACTALATRAAIDARAAPARRWAAAIAAAGFALQVAPEIVVVGRDIGRQNTFFKLYLQSWIALALASGPAAAMLASTATRAWRGGAVALAAVALAYVPIGVASRIAARMPGERPVTLDGLAFLESATLHRGARAIPLADDRALVGWLAANAPRFAVVLEAQLPEYQYGGRIASFTGLPTLLGYRFHETQQRPIPPLGDIVNLRVANVDAIFRGNDLSAARRALADYRVRYVVVGGLERAVYPEASLARFDAWVAEGVARVAFRHGDSTIYEFSPPPANGWPAL